MTRVGQDLFTRDVDTIPMRDKNLGRTRSRTDLHGKIFPVLNAGKARESSSIPHDQPRASSPINDNQCVIQLQAGLLAGSSTEETMNNFSTVNRNVVHPVHTAPGHSQKNEISPGAAVCHYKRNRLKFVKGVSCVIPLSSVKPAINAPNVATNLPVGARLQNFWEIWLDLGAGPKVVQILKEGYALPFRIWPNLTRSPTVISYYGNPHRNLNLLEALHQLMNKNAIELVHKHNSLGFFNRLFLVPKPNNKWRPILDLSNLNLFLKAEKFKMETPETNRTSLQQGEWVTSIDFKDAYFHIPIQEQSRKYLRFHVQGQTYQFKALPFRFVNSAHEVHCNSKGGETDGHTQGYKDPPVPRRLVRESHLPPALSRTYTGPNISVPEIGLAGEHGKVRTGTEASFQLCRLPVRPRVRSGPTHTGPVAKPSGKNTESPIPTGLSGPGVHVPDRSVNRHRKAGSPRPTAYETHSVASQKQLEDTGIIRKDDSTTQVPAPTLTMVANRRQCSHRPTITPNKTCSADLYRRIKRKVGRSLKRTHCQRNLVPPGKQTAYKLSRTQGSFSSLKRVPRSLHRQDGSSGNRQHYSSVLHKQGRRDEVGSSVRPTLENLDLVLQETSDFKGPTHPRSTKCGGRQAIQTRPDHPDRMVPPSRDFSDNMQQVAPTTNRPF